MKHEAHLVDDLEAVPVLGVETGWRDWGPAWPVTEEVRLSLYTADPSTMPAVNTVSIIKHEV